MLSWQKCYSDKADQKSHLGRQAGRQATREWKRNGLAYACSVSHSKLTDQTPSSTFQVEEVRRGPGETGSVTAEKLPPRGRRHWDWEVLSLTSFSFLSVSHIFLPSPVFWLALLSCLPPGGPTRFFCFSYHSQMAFISYLAGSPLNLWFVGLWVYPHRLLAWGLMGSPRGKLEERAFAVQIMATSKLFKTLHYTVHSSRQTCEVISTPIL